VPFLLGIWQSRRRRCSSWNMGRIRAGHGASVVICSLWIDIFNICGLPLRTRQLSIDRVQATLEMAASSKSFL